MMMMRVARLVALVAVAGPRARGGRPARFEAYQRSEAARVAFLAARRVAPSALARARDVVARFPGRDPARYLTVLDAIGGARGETWLLGRNGSWPTGSGRTTTFLAVGDAAAPVAGAAATVVADHSVAQNLGAAVVGGAFVAAGGECHAGDAALARVRRPSRKKRAAMMRLAAHGGNQCGNQDVQDTFNMVQSERIWRE